MGVSGTCHSPGRCGCPLQIWACHGPVTHLVAVGAHYKYGRVGGVAADGTEPEVQAGVLVALPHVPQQEINRALRQEKL
jgi:hypothetical protein